MDGISGSFPPNSLLSSSPYDLNNQLGHVPVQSHPHSPYSPYPPQAITSVPPPLIPRSGGPLSSQNAALPPPAQHQQSPNSRRKSSSDASRPVRKRITRACDQCNQLRTKCDGLHPCTHCQDLGLECQYNREQKKRGKASRKDLAERAAGKDSEPPTPTHSRADSKDASRPQPVRKNTGKGKGQRAAPPPGSGYVVGGGHFNYAAAVDREAPRAPTGLGVMGVDDQKPFYADNTVVGMYPMNNGSPSRSGFDMNPDESGENSADYTGSEQSFSPNAEYFANYHPVSDAFHNRMTPGNRRGMPSQQQPMQQMFKSPEVNDPFPQGWQHPISSSQAPFFQNPFPSSFETHNSSLRYPVLGPVLPYLDQSMIPPTLACELLEFYFASSSATHQHPLCPFILGYVFRKQSFFHLTNHRRCQPALLASMLWVAAQTSDASILTSAPSARAQICRNLHQLTLDLLKPLVQSTPWEMMQTNQSVVGGMHFNSSAMDIDTPGSRQGTNHQHQHPHQHQQSAPAGNSSLPPTGSTPLVCLDDIVAFIHLATAMSASEYKSTSIRWWTIAWTLAREMKLGREISESDPTSSTITLEQREERRKVWWLLYMVDRHLALCYNRPMHLMDSECSNLKLPMDDGAWQRGEFDGSQDQGILHDTDITRFQCRSHSVFGYFLPLMTILGDLVDMHHEKNHPRLGEEFQQADHWAAKSTQIANYLTIYEKSLQAFHSQQKQQQQQQQPHSTGRVRTDLQTRIVLTYGTYVMHVLHILLAGKWDPINLLDDSDMWISSQSFLSATSHAVSAAEALRDILELDPGLEFMPFFLGIYLLQGSFLLLLIADKLRDEADSEVIRACETIIRAHDACVATLSTDYQRNFSKVMRNTLAIARGRSTGDLGEQHRRRREMLGLYRWTRDGGGLAL